MSTSSSSSSSSSSSPPPSEAAPAPISPPLTDKATNPSDRKPSIEPPAPPTNPHDKPCALCATPRSVLVRCQIDDTQKWHFVCPGNCWRSVSGGVEDARGLEGRFPFYRYGGMWKNKHVDGAMMSAKKPRKVKERQRREREKRMEEGLSSTAVGSEDEQ